MTRNPLPLKSDQYHDEHEQHPDVKTAAEAIVYLKLDECTPTADAALQLLNRLCQSGQLSGITWGQSRLYAREQLDGVLRRAVEAAEAQRQEKLDAEAAAEAAVEAAFNRQMAEDARTLRGP